MNIRTDYSFLFSSLGSSFGTNNYSSVSSSNFLADYASIKNGSYAKLMKAYYNKQGSSVSHATSATNSTSSDNTKTLAKVQDSTDALKDAADALIVQGKDSLFKEKDIPVTNGDGSSSTVKGYDTDAIYKSVSSFISAYNSVIDAAADANSTAIRNRSANMQNFTKMNAKTLSGVGITIGSDNKLSIDEKQFKESNMTTVKSLFNEHGSYGYRISAHASYINFAADTEAGKSNTYNFMGTYSNPFSSGSIYNSYF